MEIFGGYGGKNDEIKALIRVGGSLAFIAHGESGLCARGGRIFVRIGPA
jgi:hypothetical protein